MKIPAFEILLCATNFLYAEENFIILRLHLGAAGKSEVQAREQGRDKGTQRRQGGRGRRKIYVRPEIETPLTRGAPSIQTKQESQKGRTDPGQGRGAGGRVSQETQGQGREVGIVRPISCSSWDLVNRNCW